MLAKSRSVKGRHVSGHEVVSAGVSEIAQRLLGERLRVVLHAPADRIAGAGLTARSVRRHRLCTTIAAAELRSWHRRQ